MSIRLYEFSKNSGISSKELLDALQAHGFNVANHMTVLSDDIVAFLNKHFQDRLPALPALVRQPMTVAQLCDATGLSVNNVIVFLLKKGIAAPRNYVLSENFQCLQSSN